MTKPASNPANPYLLPTVTVTVSMVVLRPSSMSLLSVCDLFTHFHLIRNPAEHGRDLNGFSIVPKFVTERLLYTGRIELKENSASFMRRIALLDFPIVKSRTTLTAANLKHVIPNRSLTG